VCAPADAVDCEYSHQCCDHIHDADDDVRQQRLLPAAAHRTEQLRSCVHTHQQHTAQDMQLVGGCAKRNLHSAPPHTVAKAAKTLQRQTVKLSHRKMTSSRSHLTIEHDGVDAVHLVEHLQRQVGHIAQFLPFVYSTLF
jgi:hypothetical protein